MRENATVVSEESETEDDEIQVVESAIGWAYVGSHNFTSSAWGTLSGSAFSPVLNVSSSFYGFENTKKFWRGASIDIKLRDWGCVPAQGLGTC